MTIKIKIGSAQVAEQPLPTQATIRLQMSKTLDGNVLIKDHQKINIIVVPSAGQVITMPKPHIGENTYYEQRQLMDALQEGGVISPQTIQGGLEFGTLEGAYNKDATDVDPLQIILLQIEKYLRESYSDNYKAEEYDQNIEDRFTDPTPEDSTALGEVPPEKDQAYTIDPTYTFNGYGYFY
jgi:hypothetical protein